MGQRQPFHIKRRQLLGLCCGSMVLSQLPLTVMASGAATVKEQLADVELLEWQGIALGADAQLKIYHTDKLEAQYLLKAVLQELERQERLFSLYREDSVISRLNKEGEVSGFANDFYWLMSLADDYVKLTHGAFDPTIQILWQSYRDFIVANPKANTEDLATEISQVKHLVGWDGIQIEPNYVRLAKPGQVITLNGLAQGFITDRITDLLQRHGVNHALINMGEIRGLLPPNHPPWTLGIADPEDATQLLRQVKLGNQAMATSSAKGTYLSYEKNIGHIFNPKTSQADDRYLSVTVFAPTAVQADALATAFAIMPLNTIKTTLEQLSDVQVWIVDQDRQWVELS